MNRGKRKTFVTVTLIVLALVAAILIEVVDGAAGGASTPKSQSTSSARSDGSPPGATNGTNGSGASAGAGTYRTVGSSVNLRAGAGTSTAIVTTMLDLGSPVTLSCYVRGSSVAGDPWWYRATFINAHGYVAGFWVNTGPDPAKTHLPAC
jgi:hypothetical protein